MRERWEALKKEEGGAVLLLSLAAVLIIMMLAWVIIDAGTSARDKIESQAQADTAAYGASSVKARSMNMVAYTNVAKRSVVGIQSMYLGMYMGYVAWVAWRWSKCKWYRPDICIDAAINSAMLLVETFGDFRRLMGLFSSGSAKKYHKRDLQAIDNYQQYMMWLTPWWSFGEAVARGYRNGATSVGTFPSAPGVLQSNLRGIVNAVRSAAGSVGLSGLFTTAGRVDRLPFKRMSYWDLFWDGMLTDPDYIVEHIANSLHHKSRSKMGAKTSKAYGLGMAAFPLAYWWITSKMDDYGKPYVIPSFSSEADYLFDTSHLVFSYGVRPDRFGDQRQKFMFMSKEYNHTLGVIDEFQYTSSGVWSMARAEISYQDGGTPEPFHPSWTARMRPVALPGEWEEAGFDLNQAYHDSMGYMALAAVVGMGNLSGLMAGLKDFVNMERSTRAFGHSTIEGIAK